MSTVKKYYPAPPFIDSVIQYLDINKDPNLRKLMTDYYLEKAKKWVPSKVKSNGYDIIYQLLRKFVKNTNTNWYDLKDKHEFVKKFIIHKLK